MSGPSPQPSATPSAPPATATSGRIHIDATGAIAVFGMGYAKGDVIDRGRVDTFHTEYPQVGLTFSENAFDSTAFLTALQGLTPPDVVRIPRDRLGSYVARGILEPLDDCIGRTGVKLGDFRDAAVKQVTVAGKVYGMPEFFWVSNWLVDNDLFAGARIKPASWDVSDWEAIRAAGQALRSRTKARVAIDPRVWQDGGVFPLWVAAAGGRMLSDDGKESLLDTREVTQALSYVKSLVDAAGGAAAITSRLGKAGTAGNMFSNNVEGAFPVSQEYLAGLAVLAPKTRFTARPFLTRDRKNVTYEEGDALAILANSDNKDAACAFVTAMTATEAWVAGARQQLQESQAAKRIETGAATGNKAADGEIFNDLVDVRGRTAYRRAINAYRSTFDAAVGMPASPSAEEFRQAWIDAIERVLAGEADVGTALRQADQEAQDAIDSAAP